MRITVVVFFKYQFFLENGYIEFFTSKLGYVSLQNPKNFQMFELPSNFRVKDSFTVEQFLNMTFFQQFIQYYYMFFPLSVFNNSLEEFRPNQDVLPFHW